MLGKSVGVRAETRPASGELSPPQTGRAVTFAPHQNWQNAYTACFEQRSALARPLLCTAGCEHLVGAYRVSF